MGVVEDLIVGADVRVQQVAAAMLRSVQGDGPAMQVIQSEDIRSV